MVTSLLFGHTQNMRAPSTPNRQSEIASARHPINQMVMKFAEILSETYSLEQIDIML